jgi:hypothetical protein
MITKKELAFNFFIFIKYKMKRVGSRAEVMHGNALNTAGGLTKKDLMFNKQGRIVSVKKYNRAHGK